MGQYQKESASDAWDMVENFREEIADQLKDEGKASTDLFNDYSNGDSYHHETHVDKDYDLKEASDLLDDLNEYEETDTGLWDGLEPRRAIAAQAAYTYGNAVYQKWREMVEAINDAYDPTDTDKPEGETEDEYIERIINEAKP